MFQLMHIGLFGPQDLLGHVASGPCYLASQITRFPAEPLRDMKAVSIVLFANCQALSLQTLRYYQAKISFGLITPLG